MLTNGKAVERVAREFVARHGADALQILRECAEAADKLGDELGAEAWRDILAAVVRLLKNEG